MENVLGFFEGILDGSRKTLRWILGLPLIVIAGVLFRAFNSVGIVIGIVLFFTGLSLTVSSFSRAWLRMIVGMTLLALTIILFVLPPAMNRLEDFLKKEYPLTYKKMPEAKAALDFTIAHMLHRPGLRMARVLELSIPEMEKVALMKIAKEEIQKDISLLEQGDDKGFVESAKNTSERLLNVDEGLENLHQTASDLVNPPKKRPSQQKDTVLPQTQLEQIQQAPARSNNRGPIKPVLNQPLVITLQPGEETGWVIRPEGSIDFLIETQYVLDGQTADGRPFRFIPEPEKNKVNPTLENVKPSKNGEMFTLINPSGLTSAKATVTFK